jgi:UDP-2,3-diacylglucosamine pyrophosphatase LpxH
MSVSRIETVVLSDLHLTAAHEPEAHRPLWMAYKRREYFVDEDFGRLLTHIRSVAQAPVELVLNGDVFDFDAVTELPKEPEGEVNWLARLRGLASEEWMSLFKLECILRDHPVFFDHLGAFLRHGGRVVFVIGNHDTELQWPSVQQRIRRRLGVDDTSGERAISGADDTVVFCAWFYVSGDDTFISHGHQFDPYCAAQSPIDPLIEIGGRPRVRVPFGDLAGRYMINGMGYFNPHATENCIMTGWAYLKFFLRYMLRTQPLLLWTWFWGALVTMVIALREHWAPALRDPLMVDVKVRDIARRSNATPAMVRKLHALSVPSACGSPLKIMRELWLDRGLLFIGVVYAAWQIILLVNVAWPASPLWVLVPLGVLLPPYFVYASSVSPSVFKHHLLSPERADLIRRITGARRVICGHTHVPERVDIGAVSYFNGGSWSPAFATPECIERIGTQTFVWIRPGAPGARHAALYEWPVGASEPRRYDEGEQPPGWKPPADEATGERQAS